MLGLLLGCVGLVTCGWLGLRTEWAKEQVRARLEASLNELVIGDVRIAALEGDLLDAITLRGIEITDEEGERILSIDSLAIDYKLLPLLQRKVDIESVRVSGLFLEVRRTLQGEFNVVRLLAPRAPPTEPPAGPGERAGTASSWQVNLGEVLVAGDARVLGEPVEQLALTLHDVGLRGGRVVARDVSLRIDDTSVVLSWLNWEAATATVHLVGSAEVSVSQLAWFVALPVNAKPLELVFGLSPSTDRDLLRLALHARSGAQRLRTTMLVDPSTWSCDGELVAQHLDLGPLLATTGSTDLELSLVFTGQAAPWPSRTAHASLEASGRLFAKQLKRLGVDAEVTAEQATLSATVVAPGGTATASARLQLDESPVRIVSSELTAELAHLDEILAPWFDARGRLRVEASGQGTSGALAYRASFLGTNLGFASYELGEAHAELQGARKEGRFAMNTTDAQLGPLRFTGAVELGAAGTEASIGELRIDLAALGTLLRQLSPWSGTGRVRGKVALDGELASASLGLEGDRVSLHPAMDPVELRGQIALRSRGLSGQITASRTSGERAELSAVLRLPHDSGRAQAWLALWPTALRSAELRYDKINLARLASALGVDLLKRGTASGELFIRDAAFLEWRGVFRGLEAPTLYMHDAEATVAAELGPGSFRMRADGEYGTYGVFSAVADGRAPTRPLAIERWDFSPARLLTQASVQFHDLTLPRALRAKLGWPASYRGQLAGELVLDGTEVAKPTVNAQELRAAPWRGAGAATVEFAIERGQASAHATVRLPEALEGEARVIGRLPKDLFDVASWRALDRAALEGATLSFSGPLASGLTRKAGLPTAVTGIATLRVALGPALLSGDAKGELRIARAPWLLQPVRLDARLTIADAENFAKLRLYENGAELAAIEARMAFGTSALWRSGLSGLQHAPIEARLRVWAAPIAMIAHALGQGAAVKGTVNAEAALSGVLGEPTLTAELNSTAITRGELAVPPISFTATATPRHLDFDLATHAAETKRAAVNTLRLVGTLLAAGESAWWAQARPAPHSPASLSAELSANHFDLRPLALVVPGLAGFLSAKLHLEGALARPTVAGTLGLDGVELRSLGPVRFLREGTATARFSPMGVQLEARAKSAGGSLALSADASRQDDRFTMLDAKVHTRALPIEIASLRGTLDTNARLHTEQDSAGAVVTTIDIGDSLVVLPNLTGDTSLHPTGPLADVVLVADGPSQPAAAQRSTGLPPLVVHLRVPDTLTVRSADARARVAVDLTLRMAEQTTMTGTVANQEGSIELFGARYRIQRAIARFDGVADSPNVDIRLVREFSNFTMIIEVSGSLDEPTLTLRSFPPVYAEAQLLSFVLGANPDEPAPADRTLDERATGVALGLLTGQLQSLIAEQLPIDVLRIELSDSTVAASKITAGKWITEKLFFAYRHRFDAKPNENSSEATIEFRFLRRWLLEAYFGDRGAAGTDLLWTGWF